HTISLARIYYVCTDAITTSPQNRLTGTVETMPEGPEIYLASAFINQISKNRLYGGQVIKSEVSTKNPDIEWEEPIYRISALSRGKELKVELSSGNEDKKNEKSLNIIFHFGMSGGFKFTTVDDLPKHAHL
ncbi:unnamed protein product, partial [Meganyctiphanes norvegica]